MSINKIVSMKARPFVLGASVAAIMGIGGMILVNKNPAPLQQKHSNEKHAAQIFDFAIIALLTYILVCGIIPVYKNGNKFAAESAKNYLTKAMKENPKLAEYKSVMQDSGVMKNIATKISGELRPSEQKRILKLVNQIKIDSTTEQIQQVHDEIAKVIKEHSVVHPEFLDHVYGYLINADYMMFVKQKQQENKIKTR